jgi:predicted transcriptional regulator
MEMRRIGSLSVSVVGLGCNNFGERLDAERTASVVQAALDAGITFFDTADIYGGTRSEEFLGRTLGRRRFLRRITMTMPSIPSGGCKTIGQIDRTHVLRFHAKQSGLAIAVELLSSHVSGAPIIDDAGKFIGLVSEFDLLGAIESGQDLSKGSADHIMNKDHFIADESTTISNAISLMKEKHLLVLPVIKKGKVASSVTRHDVLRARIGLGLGLEL